ncbi:MAG: hypothetical protein KJ887_00585 [Candidatus Omnitrophica bacterium]|nr:hypothetical protein [Candidatus Omnitrophota bacterium]MBU1047115.1 hypothetical protein [Candidatus Omnitrophota bacterium]MBU1631459.1 hypothetical protein [Candidatus Omnitrophota bacterium]MBU1767692.1 hypothetical protein [Candidatus Omnitrophota bacterium]MBU1889607.1 hypothetical protein [Candidatus Omnitrophota bacterium]
MKKETKHRWEKEPLILRKCPLKYKKTLETVIEFIAGISILWMILGLLYCLLKLPTNLLNEQPSIPIYRFLVWCLIVLGPKLFVSLYLLFIFIVLFIIVYCIGASDYLIHKKSMNKRVKD